MSEEKLEKALIIHECDHTTLVIKGDEAKPTGIEAISKVVEGQPIIGEAVFLEPRDDGFHTIHRVQGMQGPAQVATQSYRDNWDATFASKAN